MKIVICVTKSKKDAEYLISYIEHGLRFYLECLIKIYRVFTGADVIDMIYYCCMITDAKRFKTVQRYKDKTFGSYEDIDEIMEFLNKSLKIDADDKRYPYCILYLEQDDIFVNQVFMD